MRYFTSEQDAFLRDNINKCYTLYELADSFNRTFPHHTITAGNMRKRLQKLGLKKGTHNIRPDRVHHKNTLETVIAGRNHGARVKTANGYVAANKYFREKYYGKGAVGKLINLNGNKADFSPENVMLVSIGEYHSLCWRGWFFCDRELTKAAVLAVRLLAFFPDLIHNENQYYRMLRSDTE